jgi:hypothetical protein
MVDLDTFRSRYVPDHGDDNIRTPDGKSIIDLHTEFKTRKAVGERLTRKGQAEHAHSFHQDEELAAIIAQCEQRKTDSLHYGPTEDPDSLWLQNIPMEEDSGSANVVEAADATISDWKRITADARATRPGAVLHTMTNPGGRPTNLGWAVPNRFEAIADAPTEAAPSKVTDNA